MKRRLFKLVVFLLLGAVVIPATSKPDHLRDNMAAGLGRLPDKVMRGRMEGLIDAM